MLRIGLTGGIAAGKSVASKRFAQLGARVIDHDVLAREAVKPGSAAIAELVRRYGSSIIVNDELDRAALAAIVFNDPVALADLNNIVHPYVFALSRASDNRARADGVRVVVHDIPLLVESASVEADFDLIVTVAAPIEVRLRRLVDGRGLTEQEAMGRIESQASDEQRKAVADVVLDGSREPIDLYKQVDRLWHEHVPVSDRGDSVES